MRKLIVFLVISSLFIVSCQKEEMFSCNPSINDWVKANQKEIQTYKREKISLYPIEFEKAIVRSLSPEKKKMIWQEKVDYINSLTWTEEEKIYIDYFTESFKKLDYTFKNKKQNALLEDEMYEKLKEAISKFNWEREFVIELFFRVGNIGNYSIEFEVDPGQGEQPPCECYYELGCVDWSCDYGGCKVDTGCGIFGGADCKGLC